MSVEMLSAIISQIIPEPHAGLLSGILFGTKATISRDLYDALVTTGTLHIVALSGMNISIVAAFISTLFITLFSRRIVSLLTIVFIIGFIWFVGPSPSILRAGIMGTLAYMAIFFGRPHWPVFAWFITVIFMLMLEPLWVTDISFQLSVMATLGIILFGSQPRLYPSRKTTNSEGVRPYYVPHEQSQFFVRLRNIGFFLYRLIENDLRITLAAQIFTIPIILFHFNRISLISPFTNVLIVWLMVPLTAVGWFTAGLGALWMPLGRALGIFAWIMLEYIIWIVRTTSMIPFASISR